MICPKCSTKLNETDRFCGTCGTRISKKLSAIKPEDIFSIHSDDDFLQSSHPPRQETSEDLFDNPLLEDIREEKKVFGNQDDPTEAKKEAPKPKKLDWFSKRRIEKRKKQKHGTSSESWFFSFLQFLLSAFLIVFYTAFAWKNQSRPAVAAIFFIPMIPILLWPLLQRKGAVLKVINRISVFLCLLIFLWFELLFLQSKTIPILYKFSYNGFSLEISPFFVLMTLFLFWLWSIVSRVLHSNVSLSIRIVILTPLLCFFPELIQVLSGEISLASTSERNAAIASILHSLLGGFSLYLNPAYLFTNLVLPTIFLSCFIFAIFRLFQKKIVMFFIFLTDSLIAILFILFLYPLFQGGDAAKLLSLFSLLSTWTHVFLTIIPPLP